MTIMIGATIIETAMATAVTIKVFALVMLRGLYTSKYYRKHNTGESPRCILLLLDKLARYQM